MCARAWKKYEKYCEEQHIKTNRFWIRILIELLSNERSAVVIDPDLFLDGSRLEIQSFFVLMEDITFAHSFQHRYAIINSEAAQYAQEFIEVFQ